MGKIKKYITNSNYNQNNLKANNNTIKHHQFLMNDIISHIFSKIENFTNYKGDKHQFEHQNESYINQNSKNKNIKISHFRRKLNNLIILIILIFNNCLKECELSLIDSHSSNITIKIKESGINSIFFDGDCFSSRLKFDYPDEVYINNKKQTSITPQYDFTKENNVIKLVWHKSRENWGCLFRNCEKITEIDFSQFDFSKSIEGNMIFLNCKSVTSLNINDFGTVKLKDAGSFFRGMTSLTSLNLSNFDMSQVTDIGWMFASSTSLTSLDLSCLHKNNIKVRVERLFWNCPNLEYINLNNTKFALANNSYFITAKKNLVICNNDEGIIEEVKKYGCPIIDCTDNWRQKQKKINLENGECVDDCSLTNNNKYNYKNECYENCPYNNNYISGDCHRDCKSCEKGPDSISTNCKACSNPDKYLNIGNCVSNCLKGHYIDEYDCSIKICKCDLDKCDKCSKESYVKNLCISCNNGYYPKYEDIKNNNLYFDCYKSPEGYYLNSGYYKSCYKSCKFCSKSGDNINHFCMQCKDNYSYEVNINRYKNCYTYNENENNIIINDYTNFDKTLDTIFSTYESENNNNLVIKRADGIVYHISNSKNELELLNNKSKNVNNISIIDLGQCEDILRKEYHINEADYLIFIKNEVTSNKPSEKNFNFEVYEPYFKKKVNLSLCDDIPINIYFPIELSESTKQLYAQIKKSGYDMFNINDPFYQDICSPFDSSNGTDILIIDRKNYIYYNNDTHCPPNCKFSYYFIETQYMNVLVQLISILKTIMY